jgi:hypothetical protein
LFEPSGSQPATCPSRALPPPLIHDAGNSTPQRKPAAPHFGRMDFERRTGPGRAGLATPQPRTFCTAEWGISEWGRHLAPDLSRRSGPTSVLSEIVPAVYVKGQFVPKIYKPFVRQARALLASPLNVSIMPDLDLLPRMWTPIVYSSILLIYAVVNIKQIYRHTAAYYCSTYSRCPSRSSNAPVITATFVTSR